jgi:hypothetical protein
LSACRRRCCHSPAPTSLHQHVGDTHHRLQAMIYRLTGTLHSISLQATLCLLTDTLHSISLHATLCRLTDTLHSISLQATLCRLTGDAVIPAQHPHRGFCQTLRRPPLRRRERRGQQQQINIIQIMMPAAVLNSISTPVSLPLAYTARGQQQPSKQTNYIHKWRYAAAAAAAAGAANNLPQQEGYPVGGRAGG